ncbi:MAG: ABC transporter substrate-binding protein [Chloroflexi bacterium]|nr:ABC transporter substrate-binding protein [Chloroflexota bacterium]
MRRALPRTCYCLVLLGLALASCVPGVAPTPATKAPPPAKALAAQTTAPAVPTSTPKAAAEQPRYGGILTTSTREDPPHFDVQQTTTIYTVLAVAPSTSGLLQYDPHAPTEVIPDLAERWEVSADGKVYTFHLRRGVKFHDGKPATSEDAKFSLDRVRQPPQGMVSPRRGVFSMISKTEAPDENTLKVTLKDVSASFVGNIATAFEVVFPKHVIQEKGDMKATIVGTGPYVHKSYMRGVGYEAARNSNYFVKGRPFLDGIRGYIIPDGSTQFAALRTGQLTMSSPYPSILPSQVQILKASSPEVVIQEGWMPSIKVVLFNMRRPPWNDPRVRRAVNLVIDRQALVKTAMEEMADVGGVMAPRGIWALPREQMLSMPGYRQPKDADIAEAKKLIVEAGIPEGFKTEFLVRRGREFEDLGVFVQDSVKKLGIDARIRLELRVAADKDLLDGRFEVGPLAIAVPVDDPDAWFGQLYVTGAGRNHMGYSNPRLDQLFEKQARTMDLTERKGLVAEMQRIVLEDNPVAVAWWDRWQIAYWPQMRNWKIGIGIHNNNKYQDVWLAK